MKKHELEEKLVKLFLRLNGYFLTDLVIHSGKKGENKTQIDAIGVRFPFHEQKDRGLNCSEVLCIPEGKIDVLVCEVKGSTEVPKFNESLTNSPEAIEKLLSWIGIFEQSKVEKIANELKKTFTTIENDIYSLRPVLFTFGGKRNPETLSATGEEVLDFIWACFRPPNDRASCSTTYNYEAWGPDYTELVRYFKDNKESTGRITDLYKYFGITS